MVCRSYSSSSTSIGRIVLSKTFAKTFVVCAVYNEVGHVDVSCTQVGAGMSCAVEVVVSHQVTLPPYAFLYILL